MSKWAKDITEEYNAAERLRFIERSYVAKGDDPAQAEIFNAMIEMVERGKYDPAVIYAWMRLVGSITRQRNGGVVLACKSKFGAENIFTFISAPLIGHFNTKKIATTFNGKLVRYIQRDDEKAPLSAEGQTLLDKIRKYL